MCELFLLKLMGYSIYFILSLLVHWAKLELNKRYGKK